MQFYHSTLSTLSGQVQTTVHPPARRAARSHVGGPCREFFSVAFSIPDSFHGGLISGLPVSPFNRAISSRNAPFSDYRRALPFSSPSVKRLSVKPGRKSISKGGLAMKTANQDMTKTATKCKSCANAARVFCSSYVECGEIALWAILSH